MSNFALWIILFLLNKNIFAKGKDNIVLHGGNHCSGGNALIYEHGKGKKKEQLIINNDNLIMKDGESDGDIIMDGQNLILKEGKKHENIIIKGGGGGHCHEEHHEEHETHPMHVHIKPTHTKEHKVYVPVHHKKKVIHHHHHKKEVHHNDHWNSKSRKDDLIEEEDAEPRKEKRIIRKLKLGDKLSSEEKERLKFKKVDKRFGLSGLAGRMIKKIKWKKGTNKIKNNNDKKEENNENNKEENQEVNDQQNEEEEDDNTNSKDQEEDVGSNNPTLYDNPISFSSLYPGINPISGGYMAPGYNTMFLNPYQSELPKVAGNDLKKKSKKYYTKLNSEENRQTSDEEYEDVVEDVDINKTKKPKNKIDNMNLSINLTKQETNKRVSGIPQPVFTLDENQLRPAIYSILALANNLKHTTIAQPLSTSIKSLPLYTPNKSSLDTSDVSLLLPFITNQSKKQLQLIKKQQEKIILQQAENEELSKKLQQAKLIGLSKKRWLDEDINLDDKNFKKKPSDFNLKEKDEFGNYDEPLDELLVKLKNNEKNLNKTPNKFNRRTTISNKKGYIISSFDYNKSLKEKNFSNDEFDDDFLQRNNKITKRMSNNPNHKKNKFLFNKLDLNKKHINKVQLDKNATLLIYNL